jgi:hypothetical protein
MEETPSKYGFDLLKDSNLVMQARVGRAVTWEKFKDDRSWLKPRQRALWIRRVDDRILEPLCVTVLYDLDRLEHSGKVACSVGGEKEKIPLKDLIWLPSVEDYMNFEEWPGNAHNNIEGDDWWVLDPRGKVIAVKSMPNGALLGRTITEHPNEECRPEEILVVVALAWLKAWSEKDE